MASNPPAGVILLSVAMAFLGIAALAMNLLSIVLSWNRVPLGIEMLGVLYGGVAVLAAVQLWRRLRYARATFLVWAALVFVFAAILAAHLDQPLLLLPPMGLLGVLFYVAQRYIAGQTARAA